MNMSRIPSSSHTDNLVRLELTLHVHPSIRPSIQHFWCTFVPGMGSAQSFLG